MVAYRDENGTFADRESIRSVPGLGPKAFEQSAGFLRIRGGKNPLDASAIHPESYPVAEAVLKLAGLSTSADLEKRKEAIVKLQAQPIKQLAEQIGCGVPTLQDILEQLIRPGRDPRQDAQAPILRSDVLKMEDLTQGMRLKGTVRNVVHTPGTGQGNGRLNVFVEDSDGMHRLTQEDLSDMVPALGANSPVNILMVVDLPAPLGPRKP